jgi:hypothetical protein
LLTPAAYLAAEPIPLALFTTHSAQLSDIFGTAAGESSGIHGAGPAVAPVRAGPGRVRHSAARSAASRNPARPAHQQQELSTLAVRLLRAAVPTDDPLYNASAWPAWRQLLPHVLVATDSHRTLTGVEENVAWLLDRAATYLQSMGERAHARPLIERARNLRCSTVGEDHPDTLGSATHLAATLRELG